MVIVATVVAAAILLVTIGVAVRNARHEHVLAESSGFVHWLTAAVASLVLLAVIFETLPVIWVPVCG